MHADSRAVKDEFFGDLNQTSSSIPSEEPNILLRCLVRSRTIAHDVWDRVRGPDGYGETNDVGKDLLA